MQTPTLSPFNDDEFEILTFKEVCDLLKIKPSRLYYLTSANKIPFYKLDGSLRFVKQEVLEWFKRFRKRKGGA